MPDMKKINILDFIVKPAAEDSKNAKVRGPDGALTGAKSVANRSSVPGPRTKPATEFTSYQHKNLSHTDPKKLMQYVEANFGQRALEAVKKAFPDMVTSEILLGTEFADINKLLGKFPAKPQAPMEPKRVSSGDGAPHHIKQQGTTKAAHHTGVAQKSNARSPDHIHHKEAQKSQHTAKSTAQPQSLKHSNTTAKQGGMTESQASAKGSSTSQVPAKRSSTTVPQATKQSSTTTPQASAKGSSTSQAHAKQSSTTALQAARQSNSTVALHGKAQHSNNDLAPHFPSVPGEKSNTGDIEARLTALREGDLPEKINELGRKKTGLEDKIKDIAGKLKEVDSKKRSEQKKLDNIQAKSKQEQPADVNSESGRLKLPYVPGQYHESTDTELEKRLDNLKADDAKTQLRKLSAEETNLKKQQQSLESELSKVNSKKNEGQKQLDGIRQEHAKQFPPDTQQNYAQDIDPALLDQLNHLPQVHRFTDKGLEERLTALTKGDISDLQEKIKTLNKKETAWQKDQQNLRKELSKASSEKNNAQEQLNNIREKHAKDFPADVQPKQAKNSDRIALPYVPGTSNEELDARLTALREEGLPEKITQLDNHIKNIEKKISDLAKQRTKIAAEKRTIERQLGDKEGSVARFSSPDNVSKMPDSVSTSQDKAATTIQNAFRKHLTELRAKKPNSMGFVEKEYRGDKAQEKGKTFFFHMDSKNPGFTDERIVYLPATPPEIPAEGNFKTVYRQDKRFVALVTKKPGANFKQDAKVNNQDLEGLSTIFTGKVVRDNLMVIRNAGRPVLTKGPDGSPALLYVPLQAFENLTKDIASAHKEGTRFLDNKPGNIVVRISDDGKVVEAGLVDTADRMSKTSGYKRFHSDQITHTVGLLDAWINAPTLAQQLDVLEVCDNYALLTAIMEISAENAELMAAIHDSVYRQVDSAVGGKYPGVMNPGNRHLFKEWIDKHVQPKFRNHVENLLINPGKVATSGNIGQPLAAMIMFNS